jgi:hypothetical protein
VLSPRSEEICLIVLVFQHLLFHGDLPVATLNGVSWDS